MVLGRVFFYLLLQLCHVDMQQIVGQKWISKLPGYPSMNAASGYVFCTWQILIQSSKFDQFSPNGHISLCMGKTHLTMWCEIMASQKRSSHVWEFFTEPMVVSDRKGCKKECPVVVWPTAHWWRQNNELIESSTGEAPGRVQALYW